MAEVITALERRYDPACAADWDSVGLIVGDPDAPVNRVLFAVDPVAATVDQAISTGVDLLVTHHPLFLRPVTGIPTSNWKGALAHRLVRGDCALFNAHTNADRANPGVNDALADALEISKDGWLTEDGLGRVGQLAAPMHLMEFVEWVRARLPIGAGGIRVAGEPGSLVRTVALCGGAGDDLFDQARASGADVYLTSDLRHHPLSEAMEHGGLALVDAGHFATEWPWLAQAAKLLVSDLAAVGASVEAEVSSINTDAWSNV